MVGEGIYRDVPHSPAGRELTYKNVKAYIEELVPPGHFVRSAMVFQTDWEAKGDGYTTLLRGRYFDMTTDSYKTFDAACKAAERFCGASHWTWTANTELQKTEGE